jgi:hypothetical protein
MYPIVSLVCTRLCPLYVTSYVPSLHRVVTECLENVTNFVPMNQMCRGHERRGRCRSFMLLRMSVPIRYDAADDCVQYLIIKLCVCRSIILVVILLTVLRYLIACSFM